MQHLKRKIIALVMTLAMLLSLMPAAFAADVPDFPDMPAEDDPSYAAVKAAVNNGLLTGDNGKLDLGGIILRSTISKIVASAFGATDEADLSAYTDVAADGWYAEWLAKANQMGIMHGSNGKMRPGEPMTRQEAYVVLSRALNLDNGTADDLKDVEGAGDLAAWAVPEVAPLVKAGYVTSLTAAGDPITRGEFVQVMHNIFSDYISEAGTVTEVGAGSVIVSVPDVTLKDCTVQGDLVIGDGVGDGDVTLDNVKVNGRLVVRGGGVNSIHIINNSSVSSDVVVTKVNGNVRVYADATCSISVITVNDGKDDVIIEGTVGIVTVANSETPVVLKNATVVSVAVTAPSASVTLEDSKVNSVAVSAANATVELAGTTTVTTMQVDSDAEGVTVTTGAGTKITTINAGTDVTVDGDGKVENTRGEGTVADSQGNEVETTPTPTPQPSNPRPSNPQPTTPAVHTHVWATEWSKDEGTHWHACIGGGGCTTRADEDNHLWRGEEDCVCGMPLEKDHEHIFDENNWQPFTGTDLASTTHFCVCTVEGCTVTFTDSHTMGSTPDGDGNVSCTKCGYTTKAACANSHTVTTWSLDGNTHKGTCSVCGETVVWGHTWGEEIGGKVTCTAPGCGATKSVSCAQHEWVEISSTATCTEAGTLTRFCSKCGLEQTVSASAKGHSWGEAFYNEEGTYLHYCPRCDTIEEIPANCEQEGHSWGEAYYNEEGVYVHYCPRCKTTEKVPEGD